MAQKSYSGLPFINNYTSDEYKGGIQNWQISQDTRGLIYIANNFGVLEFDGTEWYLYPVSNKTKVRSIGIDPNGIIYAGCQGDFGFFSPNSFGQLTYTSLIDSLSPSFRNIDETWRIFVEDNTIFFCTFSNIYIYDPYNRVKFGTKSFTLNEALNTTTYITTFSGPKAYRSLFTLVRVYAHPDEADIIKGIWDKIRPKADDKGPDVSVTSY